MNNTAEALRHRFELGTVRVTSGVKSRLSEDEIVDVLNRHERGEWGHLSPEEQTAAEAAVRNRKALQCDYLTESGVPLLVTTDVAKNQTLVELPLDYLRDEDTEQSSVPKVEQGPFTHTPGPYMYTRDKDGVDDFWTIVTASEPEIKIASILYWGDNWREREQALANARLLAAAPDLLEWTRRLLEVLGSELLKQIVVKAKAAVAQAEGIPR
jgi:hypothetical protein